jgi:hypothetical protein
MRFNILAFGLLGALSTSAFGLGTSSGGGGVGVRCANSSGTYLETLDIHEAKLNGLTFYNLPQNRSDAVELSSYVFARHYFSGDPFFFEQYKDSLKNEYFSKFFDGQLVQEPNGNWIQQKDVNHLPLSNDYGNYKIAPNCELEQIAYFDDEHNILKINRKLFNELDYLNQAALFTHEMIYFMDRNYPSLHEDLNSNAPRTSEVSRFFVGKLFSKQPPESKYRWEHQSEKIFCRSDFPGSKVANSFNIHSNVDGTDSLLSADMHGHISPFQISSKLNFESSDLVNIGSTIDYRGKFKVSDFVTSDEYTFEIIKKSLQNPYVRFFKNGKKLGDFEEILCWNND